MWSSIDRKKGNLPDHPYRKIASAEGDVASSLSLFDPAGNQNEPLTKEDLISGFLANRPCPSSQQAVNQFKLVKMIDRNTEILPNTTVTGWLCFMPPSHELPGIWKLAVYEVPVKTNEAGKPIKTTRFEIRSVAKKFVDTYQQDNPFAPPKLLNSREATD